MIEGWIIGVIIGSASLGIAIYSVLKQQKLEKRLKEKDRLKNLAKQLGPPINWRINAILNEIRNPFNDEDLSLSLQSLSQAIISKAFDENKDIVNLTTETKIGVKEMTKLGKEKEQKQTKYFPIEKGEDVIKYLERGECYISVDCELGDGVLSYDVAYFLFRIPYFLSDLDKLEAEFGDLIEEFSPGLLKYLRDCTEEILMIAIDSAIHSKEMEVNTKEFTKTDDIGLWIYRRIIGSDELKPYLDKLEELKRELESLRNTLLTTSYA